MAKTGWQKITTHKTGITLGLVVVLAALLRLWKIGLIPPGLFGDEVDTGYQAYSILKTGRDYFGNFLPIHFQSTGDWRVPLYIYLDVFFIVIFGLTELAVRFPAAIIGIASVITVFFLARRITGDSRVGIVSSFLLAISPWHIQFSRIGLEAILLPLLFPAGLLCFWKGIEKLRKNSWIILSAILLGLTVYAYNTPKLFLPIILFFLIVLWHRDLLCQRRKLVVFVLTTVIMLVPLGLELLKGTGQARFSSVSIFSDPKTAEKVRLDRQACDYPSTVKKLIHNKGTVWIDDFSKNYLNAISTSFLFGNGDPDGRHSVGGRGELHVFELPFLLFGLFILAGSVRKNKYYQFILLWLVLVPVPAALTQEGGNHAIRLILWLPMLQIVTAIGLGKVLEYVREKQSKYTKVLVTLLVFVVVVSILTYGHVYFTHYPKNSGRWWNYGYKEIFDYVNKHENQYAKINISSSWEPSIIYTLFYSQYPPEKCQKEITTNIDNIGRYNFLSPDINRIKRGEGEPGVLYVLNPAEMAVFGLSVESNPQLVLQKKIVAPDGTIPFVIFSITDKKT